MSDFLLRLSANKRARTVVRSLGLPLPLPPVLQRASGPYEEQPLRGRAVLLGAGEGGTLVPLLSEALAAMGAEVLENDPPDSARPHALVFDATGFDDLQDLDVLHAFFHAQLRAMASCGRCIVVVRAPEESSDPVGQAARRAVEGFVRSMGKEIGRKGSTAQTVYLHANAEQHLEPVLRFLLSARSAFISGQALHVGAALPAPPQAHVQPLAGKVALVTGAARGIGEATARTLAREGARVIVMDRPAELEAAAAVANSISGVALACDITSEDAPEVVLRHLQEQHGGGVDIVVHNAGITRDKMLVNMDDARWNMVLEVNLRALVRLNEALLPSIREGGRIVCLSSIGGLGGNAGQTNYGATKAGVIGYVQGLAAPLASRAIAVNAIAPGFIETQMTAQMPMGPREVGRRLSSLSQGGQPQDVAEAITFLSTPGATGMTGQVLRVCGQSFLGA